MTQDTSFLLLVLRIHEISQAAFCAGWHTDVEFLCWEQLLNGPMTLGRLEVTRAQVEELRSLAAQCGGWILWSERHEGPVWVSLKRWEKRYKKRARFYTVHGTWDMPYYTSPLNRLQLWLWSWLPKLYFRRCQREWFGSAASSGSSLWFFSREWKVAAFNEEGNLRLPLCLLVSYCWDTDGWLHISVWFGKWWQIVRRNKADAEMI